MYIDDIIEALKEIKEEYTNEVDAICIEDLDSTSNKIDFDRIIQYRDKEKEIKMDIHFKKIRIKIEK